MRKRNNKKEVENSTTIENEIDIVANEKVLDEYNEKSQRNYDFGTLYKTILNDPKYNSLDYDERYKLFIDCCDILSSNSIIIEDEEDKEEDEDINKLYMYFISLEDEKMFLHTDFKCDYDEVMEYCKNNFEFVKLYQPRKVIFVMEIKDLYDVDKYVKMFMHMFGIDETRGGSYTSINLEDFLIKSIEYEKKITSIDYYTKKKIMD